MLRGFERGWSFSMATGELIRIRVRKRARIAALIELLAGVAGCFMGVSLGPGHKPLMQNEMRHMS